jgi:hypothetical protein
LSLNKNALTFSSPSARTTHAIGIDSTYATIASLNLKENGLNFSSPLVRTANSISINTSLTSYNDLTNKPTSTFLLITAGTLTGSKIFNTTNPYFVFGNAGGAAVGKASDVDAFSSSAAIGDCIVRSQPTKRFILQSGSGAALRDRCGCYYNKLRKKCIKNK